MSDKLADGKYYIHHKQDIAHIIKRSNGEQHVVQRTYSSCSAKIQYRFFPGQTLPYAVNCSYSYKHNRPNRMVAYKVAEHATVMHNSAG